MLGKVRKVSGSCSRVSVTMVGRIVGFMDQKEFSKTTSAMSEASRKMKGLHEKAP